MRSTDSCLLRANHCSSAKKSKYVTSLEFECYKVSVCRVHWLDSATRVDGRPSGGVQRETTGLGLSAQSPATRDLRGRGGGAASASCCCAHVRVPLMLEKKRVLSWDHLAPPVLRHLIKWRNAKNTLVSYLFNLSRVFARARFTKQGPGARLIKTDNRHKSVVAVVTGRRRETLGRQ